MTIELCFGRKSALPNTDLSDRGPLMNAVDRSCVDGRPWTVTIDSIACDRRGRGIDDMGQKR
jgi:hypothetical protein